MTCEPTTVTWHRRLEGDFHELPDWDPLKPGVLSRYDSGEFVPFPTQADTLPIPELLAYYDDWVARLDDRATAHALTGESAKAERVQLVAASLAFARDRLREAYRIVRHSYGTPELTLSEAREDEK